MSTLQESVAMQRASEQPASSSTKAKEEQSALVIMLWSGVTWVLPWAQFLSARFEKKKAELCFGSCRVIVTGNNLEAFVADLAGYRIGILRGLPAEYQPPNDPVLPWIESIEVIVASDEATKRLPG